MQEAAVLDRLSSRLVPKRKKQPFVYFSLEAWTVAFSLPAGEGEARRGRRSRGKKNNWEDYA